MSSATTCRQAGRHCMRESNATPKRRNRRQTMKMIDAMLAEMDQEAQTTVRVLERVPQGKLSWKPHVKSMSLGQLALHVATVPGLVAQLAAEDTVPDPPAFVQPEAATAAELVPALRDSVARARTLLGGFD